MPARILVINPNSTEAVTRGIDEAVEPLRMAGGPGIVCMTLAEGPPGIETQHTSWVPELALPQPAALYRVLRFAAQAAHAKDGRWNDAGSAAARWKPRRSASA